MHVDAPEDERERLSSIGDVLGNAVLVRGLETLGQAVVDMRGTDAADPRLVLEIALVRLARRDTGGTLQVLADRVERLEQRLNNGSLLPTAPALRPPPPAAGTEPARDRRARKPPAGVVQAAPKSPALRRRRPAEPAKPGKKRASARSSRRRSLPSVTRPPPSPASDQAPPASDVVLDLDDVIVAWNAVLEALPRSLRSAIQEAQPLSVDGNVITFGVSAPRSTT